MQKERIFQLVSKSHIWNKSITKIPNCFSTHKRSKMGTITYHHTINLSKLHHPWVGKCIITSNCDKLVAEKMRLSCTCKISKINTEPPQFPPKKQKNQNKREVGRQEEDF